MASPRQASNGGPEIYVEDSLFTLSAWKQAGLILLSLTLSISVSALFWYTTGGFRRGTRILTAIAFFWIFDWLSPQVYYAYYRQIIDGLPQQLVIGEPPTPRDIFALMTFTAPANLSAHGRGVLAWALITLALVRRR